MTNDWKACVCSTIQKYYCTGQTRPQRAIYILCLRALPNVSMPITDSTLRAVGMGFPERMALGIDEPPKTTEARRASSTP